MKPWIVHDAVTGQYLGRTLAQDEAHAQKLAAEFWKKTKAFKVKLAEEEDPLS